MIVFNGQMMIDLSPASSISSLKGCFLECLRISRLLNVIVRFEYEGVKYLVSPNSKESTFDENDKSDFNWDHFK